jgi:hypothetical protein
LFKDFVYLETVKNTWKENTDLFNGVLNSITVYKTMLKKASENECKKWNSCDFENSIEKMKKWIKERIDWINQHV